MKKRTIVIMLLALLVLSPAFAENDLTLTYRQLLDSRALKVQLNAPYISYCVQIKQDNESGLFSFEAPPFLLANIDDRIRIGEIQNSGIFSVMLDPMSAELVPKGFKHGGNFKSIRNPSIDPVLSGMAISFDYLDLIALSPVFNPDSPYGFGAIGGFGNLFAGFMLATQNEKMLASATEHYQVNWKQLGIGQHMFFSIVGASGSADLGEIIESAKGLKVTGMIFAQNAWDGLLGGGTTVGWDLGLKNRRMKLNIEHMLGGFGVKLKSLTDKDKPVDSFALDAEFTDSDNARFKAGFSYGSDTYETPVYGGESQRRELKYSVYARYGNYRIEAKYTTDFDIDRGKISKSTYIITAKAFDSEFSVEIPLFRPYDDNSYIADVELSLSTKRADLKVEEGKTHLEFKWEYQIEDCTLRLSIDQDRLITASLKLLDV